MEVSQSIYQSIFTRAYETTIGIGLAILSSGLYFLYSQTFDFKVLITIIVSTILIFIAATVLLHLTTPMPHRKICFYEDRLEFYTYDRKRVVNWDLVKGYKIKKSFFPQFIIEIEGWEDIKFSYYTFSKEQRISIMRLISEYS
ncbi:MAG: hypothetical protein WA981_06580 [Glaciecola sp.]